MTRRAEITVTINDQTVMCWFSLIVKDVARGVEPHVMWWLLEGIEPCRNAISLHPPHSKRDYAIQVPSRFAMQKQPVMSL